MCFVSFECAGMDIVNLDKTETKPIKRARDWERVSRAGAGNAYKVDKAQKVKSSPS